MNTYSNKRFEIWCHTTLGKWGMFALPLAVEWRDEKVFVRFLFWEFEFLRHEG